MTLRKNLRHRSLGFESLEVREMLSVTPLAAASLSDIEFHASTATTAESEDETLFPKPEVKGTTATSITLQWDATKFNNIRESDPFTIEKKTLNAKKEDVWVQVGSSIPFVKGNASGIYSYEITGLTASTEYELRVTFGSTSLGKGVTESVKVSTMDGELKAEAASSTSVKLSWTIAARSSTYYYVERLVGANWVDTGQKVKADSNATKSFTLTEIERGDDLEPGAEYTFRLKYNDSNNAVKYSQSVSVRTLYTLNRVTSTADSVNLSWNTAMGGTDFTVQVCAGTLAKDVEANWSAATYKKISETEYQITGLKTNTSYYFRVKYKTTTGTGDAETTVVRYTDVFSFSTPTTVKVGEVTASSIALSWSFAGKSGTPYYVQISDVGGDDAAAWRDVSGGSTTSREYTIKNLEAGRTYYVRVRYTGSTDGKDATTAAETVTTGIETKLDKVTESSATISWAATGTKFNIQRCDGTLDPKSETNWATIATDVSGKTYTNNHLAANKKYYYRVQYTNAADETVHTIYVAAVTNATLKVTDQSIDTVDLYWDFVPKTVSVQVFRGSSAPGESAWTNATVDLNSDKKGCTVTGLLPDNNYFFRILYTTEAAAAQHNSTVVSTRTEIGNFIMTESSSGSMILRWAKTGLTGYPSGKEFVIRQADYSGLSGHSDWATLGSISATENSCEVYDLLADTRYKYQIGYMDGSTFKLLATLDNDTVRTLPNSVEITDLGKSGAKLQWTFATDKDLALNDGKDGDGKGKYVLQQFVPADPTQVPTEADRTSTSSNWVTVSDAISRDNKFYVLENLATNSTQYYRIVYTYRTGDAETGPGAQYTVSLVTKYSEIVTVTTKSDIHSGGGTDSVNVSWDKATNLKAGSSYTLQKRLKGTETWSNVGSTTALKLDATGLAANTDYEFRVMYADSGNNTCYTAILPLKTEPWQLSVTSKGLEIDTASATVDMQYTVGAERNFKLYYRTKQGSDVDWTLTEANVVGTPSPTDRVVRFSLPNLVPENEYEFKVVYELTATGEQRESAVKEVAISDELMPSEAKASSVRIDWDLSSFDDKAEGASFFVEWRIADSADDWSESKELDHDATTYTVTGLNGNTEYEFRVRYATIATATAYSTLKNVTTLEPSITVTKPQFGSVKVAWNFPSGAGGFVIEYLGADDNWYTAKTVSSNDTREATFSFFETVPASVTDTDVQPETEYTFRIKYKTKSGGADVYSTEQTITTLYGIRVVDNSITANSVGLEWDYTTVDGSTYKLEYHEKGTGSGNYVPFSSSLSSSTRSATIPDLKPGVEYEFRLTYHDSMERHAYVTVAIPSSVPEAPTGASVSDIKSGGATIHWTDNSVYENLSGGYVIEYTNTLTGAKSKVVIDGSLGTGPMEFGLTGLDPKTKYTVKIYARNAEGDSTALETTLTTSDVQRPNAVQNLKAAVTPTTITLTWTIKAITDFPDPAKFRIEYYNKDKGLWFEVETIENTTSTTTTKEYVISGSFTYGVNTTVKLEAKTEYQFRVIAISDSETAGEAYGESPAVTVKATPPAPTAPSSVSAKSTTISSTTITFKDTDKLVASSKKTYTIEIVEGKIKDWTTITDPRSVVVDSVSAATVVDGLKAGTTYSYVVKSVYSMDGVDVEAVSKISTFTTTKLPTVSSGKGGFTLTNDYELGLVLSWKPPATKTIGDTSMTFKITVSSTGKAGTFATIDVTDAVLTASKTQYTSTILFSTLYALLKPSVLSKFSSFYFQVETTFGTETGTSVSKAFRVTLPKFVAYV